MAEATHCNQTADEQDRQRMALDALSEIAELNRLAYTADIGEAGKQGLCLRIDDLTVIAMAALSDELETMDGIKGRLYGDNILMPTH